MQIPHNTRHWKVLFLAETLPSNNEIMSIDKTLIAGAPEFKEARLLRKLQTEKRRP